MNTDTTPVIVDWVRIIRGEFDEIPGLHLTRPQAQRLWGLDSTTCGALLDSLVAAGYLRLGRDGQYLRADAGYR